MVLLLPRQRVVPTYRHLFTPCQHDYRPPTPRATNSYQTRHRHVSVSYPSRVSWGVSCDQSTARFRRHISNQIPESRSWIVHRPLLWEVRAKESCGQSRIGIWESDSPSTKKGRMVVWTVHTKPSTIKGRGDRSVDGIHRAEHGIAVWTVYTVQYYTAE